VRIAVFTKNFSNPAYEAARLGATRAAVLGGASVSHYVPESPDDPEQQSLLIERALVEGTDAVVISPVHPSHVDAALARIATACIPLFAFVNPVSSVPCVSYVGADDRQLAHDVAGYLFDRLGGRGRILVVSGHIHSVTSLDRMRGFEEAIAAAPGIKPVARLVGNYQREIARRVVSDWLDSSDGRQGVDGCLVANDVMALGVLDALRAAGHRSQVVGVNAIPEAIRAIRTGLMLATADFNAMQMASLITECALRHLRGEKAPSRIDLPVELVDIRNASHWDLPYEQRAIKTLEEVLSWRQTLPSPA